MPNYYQLEAEAVLNALNVTTEQGLSEAEIQRRRQEHGPNELPRDEGINWLELIGGQFNDLMVMILLVAAGISLILGETPDFVVIMIIVVLNAALGIYQEYQAEQALNALSAMQVPKVRVRRGGEVRQISAEELVPGDIVLLDEGDSVPADGRIVEAANLRVEEAALTGESVPVDKNARIVRGEGQVALGDRSNMVFMGTAVNYGRGTMVVTQTGLRTEIGNIATMLLGVEEGTTPLQRRLNQLGQVLAAGAGLVVLIVFIVGVVRLNIPLQEMFLIAVSLAVAAVPEGLPALVTIGLSLGASRMVKRNALIRRLPAVETLGSVTVICSDKTGTLTKNEMTATYLALPGHDDLRVTGIGYTPRGDFTDVVTNETIDPKADPAVARFLKAMALSTNAYLEPLDQDGHMNVVGDTTEGALIVAAQKVGWTRQQLEEDLPRVAELPFSSERKAMTTIHNVDGAEARDLFDTDKVITITKGAPDRLIDWAMAEHCPSGIEPMTDDRRASWHRHTEDMAGKGLRVLGVAYRKLDAAPDGDIGEDIERELIMLGLVGILDPARPEAREAVKTARNAGIRVIMITGDHALTAEAIARDLGILGEDERAITGNQLDTMDDAAIKQALEKTSCFARVSPQHKLKLVQLLQSEKNIAAMTGDGVNDAPALKQADIGVAMGITGTDVSKQASDMVLTDDNFASIVAAVEEGRAIYDNIRKFIKYLLSSNVGEILVMFTALLAGFKIPLLALQILWINLVTDGLPAIALGFEPAESDVMDRKPRPTDESIFASGTGRHIVWVGVLIAALTLGGFYWGHLHHGLEPFSDTLGLENFDREELVALVGDADDVTIPDDWDAMSTDERLAFIQPEGGEGAGFEAEGSGHGIIGAAERIPRTIAFTILAFTQMFEVMAIHTGDRVSFFRRGFAGNRLLLGAVILTFVLQLIVIYVPFMQTAFSTAPLTALELFITFLLGAVVLFGVEVEKWVYRKEHAAQYGTPATAGA